MTTRSLRVLCQIDFPAGTARLWDGSGPLLDASGNLWRGCHVMNGLDVIEAAINGEAYVLELGLFGVPEDVGEVAWNEYQAGETIGAGVQIMLQPCDEYDQPSGAADVVFTGRIDNIRFDEAAAEDGIVSNIVVEVANRFVIRRLRAGSVLSHTDQVARSAILNPDGEPDRFCERVPGLVDKQTVWPRWD